MTQREGFLALAGRDGVATLLLASAVATATLGTSLLAVVARVLWIALRAPTSVGVRELALVPGLRLQQDEITPAFAERLERARMLLGAGQARRVMLLGGITGQNLHAEAARARDWLLAHGAPANAILIEDRSRHTLENLWEARTDITARLPELRDQPLTLVSSRTHLARCLTLGRGLGLQLHACAAEERLALGMGTLVSVLRESWLLHWYYVGRCWSRWTARPSPLSINFI